MYKLYDVKIRVRNRLVGGIPKHPGIIKAWVEARTGYDDERARQIIEETKSAVDAAEALGKEVAQKAWTGFKHDEKGLYLEARNIKAMLKENANILKGIKGSNPIIDIRNLKARLAERVFVEPDRIYLGVKEPTGYEERTISVMTPQGPRTAIKRFDYVAEPIIEFRLRVLNDGLISKKDLEVILEHAGYLGLGANRSQGDGQFEVLSFEEVK